jgi:hypothetical protein
MNNKSLISISCPPDLYIYANPRAKPLKKLGSTVGKC